MPESANPSTMARIRRRLVPLPHTVTAVTWRVTRVDTRLNGPCVTTTHLVDAPLPFVALRAVAGHHGDTQGPAYLLTGVRGSPGPPWRWTLRRFGKLIRYTVRLADVGDSR